MADDRPNESRKTPKFTDGHRYTTPYIRSESTDVAATFERVRRRLAEKEKECPRIKPRTLRLR
jgi:hypothetical protein